MFLLLLRTPSPDRNTGEGEDGVELIQWKEATILLLL